METLQLFTILSLLFWFLYATIYEYNEQKNAYSSGKVNENDKIHTCIRKFEICLTYDRKTILWRRTLISTSICVLLIFMLIHVKIPTSEELLLHFGIIFAVFYGMYYVYMGRTCEEAIKYGKENIERIKKILKTEKSFILPW